jgi:hypothetical protein
MDSESRSRWPEGSQTFGQCCSVVCDEDAERMAGRVGEHEERLLRISTLIIDDCGTQCDRSGSLLLELVRVRDGEVEVKLLVHRPVGPGHSEQLVHSLQRNGDSFGGADRDPVRVLVGAVGRGLVTRSVLAAEQGEVERGELSRVLRVEHDLS